MNSFCLNENILKTCVEIAVPAQLTQENAIEHRLFNCYSARRETNRYQGADRIADRCIALRYFLLRHIAIHRTRRFHIELLPNPVNMKRRFMWEA